MTKRVEYELSGGLKIRAVVDGKNNVSLEFADGLITIDSTSTEELYTVLQDVLGKNKVSSGGFFGSWPTGVRDINTNPIVYTNATTDAATVSNSAAELYSSSTDDDPIVVKRL